MQLVVVVLVFWVEEVCQFEGICFDVVEFDVFVVEDEFLVIFEQVEYFVGVLVVGDMFFVDWLMFEEVG